MPAPARTPNIGVALGGIIACGALYFAIGLIVQAVGTDWIEKLLPPVVTGAVVAAIGLNLTAVAMNMISASAYTKWIALFTVVAVALVAVYGRGLAQRLPVLIGGLAAYVVYAADGLELRRAADRFRPASARPPGSGCRTSSRRSSTSRRWR